MPNLPGAQNNRRFEITDCSLDLDIERSLLIDPVIGTRVSTDDSAATVQSRPFCLHNLFWTSQGCRKE